MHFHHACFVYSCTARQPFYHKEKQVIPLGTCLRRHYRKDRKRKMPCNQKDLNQDLMRFCSHGMYSTTGLQSLPHCYNKGNYRAYHGLIFNPHATSSFRVGRLLCSQQSRQNCPATVLVTCCINRNQIVNYSLVYQIPLVTKAKLGTFFKTKQLLRAFGARLSFKIVVLLTFQLFLFLNRAKNAN